MLFLPAAAPWSKIAETIEYLRAVAPRSAVPIHEAVVAKPAIFFGHLDRLGPEKTTFRVLDPGTSTTL